jgi:Cdc6-like AAA superfamily ATPase
MDITSPEVDKLAALLEEATRAQRTTTSRFVEPAQGTLNRARSSRHHIVFGRRGSGKSSLLQKACSELSLERKPVAYIDLETFKGHNYPDVLLSVLFASVQEFENWVQTVGSHPASRTTFWKRIFGAKPSAPPLDKKERDSLLADLKELKTDLERLLHSDDQAALSTKQTLALTSSDKANARLKHGPLDVGGSTEEGRSASVEATEETKRSKIDSLHRNILRFKRLFEQIGAAGQGRAFLVLDDLYHIRRSDQAAVLDYFHRIAKNSGVWIKIGTIRHRTDHYRHGDPSIGMKLGDDADDIDLDLTLEKYDIAKRFLGTVLQGFLSEAGIHSKDDIFAEATMDRLVLASGGVARDFLGILRKAIECARERGNDVRGPRVGAEDVNRAAGEHETSKRDELRRDAAGDRTSLEAAFSAVREFCLEKALANCFLIERDLVPECKFILDELVDLKMLHLVRSRVTVRDRKGKFFIAYMLDLSQYSNDRKRRDLEVIQFWKDDAADDLRRTGLVFDLSTLREFLPKVTGGAATLASASQSAGPS